MSPLLQSKPSTKRSPAAESDASDLATGSNAPGFDPPKTLEKALGLQVRMLRRQRELSVVDHASAAGIGMMSKNENGQISSSLSTVQSIAGALKHTVASLVSAIEEKRDCSFVPKGHGVMIERSGRKAGHVYELLGTALGIEPYLITLREDAAPYTGFRHTGIVSVPMNYLPIIVYPSNQGR